MATSPDCTATDPREGQYPMGLDPSGYERPSPGLPSNSNKGEFNTQFQSPCPSSHLNSSEGLAFQGQGGERATLKPFFAAGGVLIHSSRRPRRSRSSGLCPARAPRATPPVAAASRCASPKIEEVIPAAAASATGDDERPAKISFSGDRSNHPRSISGTRKRSKQLIYAAADQNGDGAEAHGSARPGSAIHWQYLNC
ncbi:hypothetical protein PtB15_15B20 [Puccinia triticina]|nr:hypothetical protein PtB15_15B20 [Puccinia triticina]